MKKKIHLKQRNKRIQYLAHTTKLLITTKDHSALLELT
jgi:hypothetical protein